MKIRHPALMKMVSWLGAKVIRAWMGTLRYRYRPLGLDVDAARMDGVKERLLGIFWHENILLPAYTHGRPDIRVLISRHADGQMMADVCERLGFGLVRGSTTRGGIEALREMLRVSQHFHVAVTPDGPRGPRRQLQPGVIYLAARTGMPILVMGIGYDRPWRLNSWDRFAIPRPFSRATFVSGDLIWIPPSAERDDLEHFRKLVENELERVTTLAERWAESGTWPGSETETREAA
jgi:hypothetical protein